MYKQLYKQLHKQQITCYEKVQWSDLYKAQIRKNRPYKSNKKFYTKLHDKIKEILYHPEGRKILHDEEGNHHLLDDEGNVVKKIDHALHKNLDSDLEPLNKNEYLKMYKPEQHEVAKPFIKWAKETLPNKNWKTWAVRNHRDNPDSFTDEVKGHLEHFSTMTHIPEVKDLRFNKEHTFDDGIELFRHHENEYNDKIKNNTNFATKPKTAKKILDLGGGRGWWSLGTHRSESEGKAMGHCGNCGSENENNEDILSLRTEHKLGNKTYHEPHLTFINDKEHNTLGEMKGRGNTKPAPHYHDDIVKLIGQGYIPVGGGYLPESNFHPDDLQDHHVNHLLEKHPQGLFGHSKHMENIVHHFTDHPSTVIRSAVAKHPNVSPETLHKLHQDEDWYVRSVVAKHPNASPETLHNLHQDEHRDVRSAVAEHPNTPSETLHNLHQDENEDVRYAVAERLQNQLKKSSLIKGSLQQRFPFDPLSPEAQDITQRQREWTLDEEHEARQQLPKMEGAPRRRSLNKLMGQTQYRKNPKTNEMEFLMHRGVSHREKRDHHAEGGVNYPEGTRNSWTPHHDIAKDFSGGDGEKVVSTWVPERSLVHSVRQYATPDPKQVRAMREEGRQLPHRGRPETEIEENEWVVEHDSPLDHHDYVPEITDNVQRHRQADKSGVKSLHERITRRGKTQQDHHREMQEILQDLAMSENKLQYLNKNVKEILRNVGIGAAMFSGAHGLMESLLDKSQPERAIAQEEKVVEQPKEQTPEETTDQLTQTDRFLKNISMLESSGGINTNHKKMRHGIHRGHRAIGKYGLMPNTIREMTNRMHVRDKLPEDMQHYRNMHPKHIGREITPEHEEVFAKFLADHLLNRFDGDERKAAFAWNQGHNIPTYHHNFVSGNYQKHPYVKRYDRFNKQLFPQK